MRLGAFLLLATVAAAQGASIRKSKRPDIPEPKLPVIDHKACPGEGIGDIREKIRYAERMYSSWQDKRVLAATLKDGEEVTVLAGVNVIRRPDVALVMAADGDSPLKPGDTALRYGLHADGRWDVWSKGTWWEWRDEDVVEKGGRCGFGLGFSQGGCVAQIIENGVKEWWVHVKTNDGRTGWVFAGESIRDTRLKGGNFSDLCSLD